MWSGHHTLKPFICIVDTELWLYSITMLCAHVTSYVIFTQLENLSTFNKVKHTTMTPGPGFTPTLTVVQSTKALYCI